MEKQLYNKRLGLFHPNPTLHHIKKENIGLIEVMGLAVLPSRLAGYFDKLEKVLVEGEQECKHAEIEQHLDWIADIRKRYAKINKENAKEILEQAAFLRFVEQL